MARPNVGSVLDAYTRADGGVGANYTVEPFNDSPSAFNIVSNVAIGVNHSDHWYNTSFANSAGIACGITLAGTLPAKTASGGFEGWYFGLIQQPSASSNTADGYQVGLRRRSGGTGKDTITVWKYTNVSTIVAILAETDLATDLVIGDTFDLEVGTGATNNIKVYRNGTVISTITDTTYFHAGESAFPEISIVNNGTPNVTGYDDLFAGQISGITSVTKTLSASYNVRTQISKTLSPSYTVKQAIAKTLSPSYTVKKAITKTLVPAYNVIMRVTKTLTASFNVRALPVNTVAPAVTGTATSGNILTTDHGTWNNTPTGYTVQWQVETGPGTGVYVDIPGETADTLQL